MHIIPITPVVTNASTERDSTSISLHGRGGAGNVGPVDNVETEESLKIPVLKSPVYTTGRGGNGNMAQNDPNHPEKARIAQDVEEAPKARGSGDFHAGRGGAGNVMNPEEIEAALAREDEEKRRLNPTNGTNSTKGQKESLEPIDHSKIDYRGWADRGKDKLFGLKKKITK
ncbi:uncharacterized protein H6S33_010649 [Morchella sextelata]|uniref:uncharacterized protein n=1 Tax=Morchella sextelata TaxID=1174677 RepID=UPI001D04800B|nr:uncharacterized protein H6S33_010649 [Morchella sextelata]KAH0611384.1 hypothetical protein H6S33_010649 [Morchella sextelata]